MKAFFWYNTIYQRDFVQLRRNYDSSAIRIRRTTESFVKTSLHRFLKEEWRAQLIKKSRIGSAASLWRTSRHQEKTSYLKISVIYFFSYLIKLNFEDFG